MTIAEMHSELERKLRNLDVVLDIPTSEISKTFYEALYKFIDKYYETFEEDEKSRKALSLLTVNTTIEPTVSTVLENSYEAIIPSEVLYVVLELVTISGEVVKVKPTTLDSYRINLDNPFKKPYSKLVWRVEMIPTRTSNKLHLLILQSGTTLTGACYTLGYIKKPTYMAIEDSTSGTDEMEVPEIFQYEIIDMALQMLLQSHSILNSKQNV
ncbi:MAG TPA: hypothetical protein PLG47_04695 [Candidatus Dojkabacteria bacterium]|mgnify:CR=1 FL=1|nr:hypothetical protein [Candidatus Dojkabacteria bacterium]